MKRGEDKSIIRKIIKKNLVTLVVSGEGEAKGMGEESTSIEGEDEEEEENEGSQEEP